MDKVYKPSVSEIQLIFELADTVGGAADRQWHSVR
jgi:hypothetical protein